MKNKLVSSLILGGIMTMTWFACQKQTDFDKQAMLEAIIDNYVLPTIVQLNTQNNIVEEKTNAFINNPSTSTLQEAQEAWRNSMQTWSEIEMLYFGPGRENYLYLQIDNTPAAPYSVETAIADASITIDSLYVRRRSSYTKGLATIEYLLHSDADQAVIVSAYASSASKTQRANYLRYAVINYKARVQEVYEGWSYDGGNYATELAMNTSNTTLGGISRFSNSIIHMSQTIARKKIGKPLGKESSDGTIRLENLESPSANFSWDIILHNLKGIKQIFGTSSEGLGAYLSSILADETVTTDIANQITALEAAIDGRTLSLEDDLINNVTEVDEIYAMAKKLNDDLDSYIAASFAITVLPNTDDGD